MAKSILLRISGAPVFWDGEMIEYHGELTVCADGSPRAYGPDNIGIDYTGNAGYPGNWWGVVTDSSGNPIVQQKGHHRKWPWPGFWVSCTAYKYSEYPSEDCRAWVDAEKVAYSVIPSSVRMAVEPKFMGCRAEIKDVTHDKELECVCAEVGPSHHLGEASMMAANYFGLNPDPKNGGSCDKKRFRYRFWPGVPANGWKLI